MRSVILFGIICTLGCATWSKFQLDFFYVHPAFHTNYILQLICGFFFTSLNTCSTGRFCMESRRLLTLTRGVTAAIFFCFIEAFLYQFFFGSASYMLSSNWPTLVAYLITNITCSFWTQALSTGYTALGVITKEIFTTSFKSIFNFKNISNIDIEVSP